MKGEVGEQKKVGFPLAATAIKTLLDEAGGSMGNVRPVRCFATSASCLLPGPGSGFERLEGWIFCGGKDVYWAKCPDFGF